MDFWTILLGIMILFKYDKLKAVKDYQRRYFNLVMSELAECYEIDKNDLFKKYVECKF
jgi:hypothetical protein